MLLISCKIMAHMDTLYHYQTHEHVLKIDKQLCSQRPASTKKDEAVYNNIVNRVVHRFSINYTSFVGLCYAELSFNYKRQIQQ